MSRVAVIIPAYNEADRIAGTVKAAKSIAGVTEVIVIDDGSTDSTSGVARSAGADRVIPMSKNSGKGAALACGIGATDAEILLLLDADLGSSAVAVGALLEPVLNDHADMTIAVLPAVERRAGFGLAVGLARWGIKKFTGLDMRSPISGQRAVRKEIIDRMGGFDPGFGVETGLTIDAFRMGYRILEVPVELTHRATGRDLRGFLHRGRQFLAIARTLLVRCSGGICNPSRKGK